MLLSGIKTTELQLNAIHRLNGHQSPSSSVEFICPDFQFGVVHWLPHSSSSRYASNYSFISWVTIFTCHTLNSLLSSGIYSSDCSFAKGNFWLVPCFIRHLFSQLDSGVVSVGWGAISMKMGLLNPIVMRYRLLGEHNDVWTKIQTRDSFFFLSSIVSPVRSLQKWDRQYTLSSIPFVFHGMLG